jgi:hypothetical protein
MQPQQKYPGGAPTNFNVCTTWARTVSNPGTTAELKQGDIFTAE